MKIVLIIPGSSFLINDKVFPFLGPLQIAAVAREHGHEISVIDLSGFRNRNERIAKPTYDDIISDNVSILEKSTELLSADVVGFYSMTTLHGIVSRLMHETKKLNRSCKTIIGGPKANLSPSDCLKDGFDFVVVSDQGGGGGELGFLKTLSDIEAGKQGPEIVSIPSRKGVKWEGDAWPFPARDLIDIASYDYRLNGEKTTSIVTMSGCPFSCSYCSHWCGYRKIEGKSSDYVRREIESVRSNYGLNAFMFYDDEINLRPGFLEDFLPMLLKLGVTWRAFFKGGKNLTRESTFEQMAASGCVQLCTGAESAHPKVLSLIRKKVSIEDNTNFIKFCVKNGIQPKVFTQVGLPGESRESIRALRDWLVAMVDEGLSDADIAITTPLEGAPLFEKQDEYDIHYDKATIDFSSKSVAYKTIPGEYESHIWHDNLSKSDIVELRQWVEDEFRSAAKLDKLR